MEPIEDLHLADILNQLADSIHSYAQLSLSPAPSYSVETIPSSKPHQLIELLDVNDHLTIFDLWSPDVWSLLLLFAIAIAVKLAYHYGLSEEAIERTQTVLSEKYGHEVEKDVARSVLKKPLSYTACFVLQCCAWRLWRIDDRPLRRQDEHYILAIIKLLLLGYASDLLLADKGYDIYLHHCFSFILLFVGQCTLFWTQDSVFPRLANWMLLQATCAMPLYVGLGLLQAEKYLQVQDHKPHLQKHALKHAYSFLRVMKWGYLPQKVVPSIFCLYWLGKMWNDVEGSAWGIAWLACATITVPLLLFLQVFVLSDSVTAMTAFIGHRVNGGPLPPKRGPIARFVLRFIQRTKASRMDQSPSTTLSEKDEERLDPFERANSASTHTAPPALSLSLLMPTGRAQ
ncbi:hypothetical protein JCM16303_002056 [Sporobolomyces ruberrimus]